MILQAPPSLPTAEALNPSSPNKLSNHIMTRKYTLLACKSNCNYKFPFRTSTQIQLQSDK